MTRPLLSIPEARALLNVGDSTMRGLIKSGKVPALRVGRVWRIDPDGLDAYIERQMHAARGTTVAAAVEKAFDADDHLDNVGRNIFA